MLAVVARLGFQGFQIHQPPVAGVTCVAQDALGTLHRSQNAQPWPGTGESRRVAVEDVKYDRETHAMIPARRKIGLKIKCSRLYNPCSRLYYVMLPLSCYSCYFLDALAVPFKLYPCLLASSDSAHDQ